MPFEENPTILLSSRERGQNAGASACAPPVHAGVEDPSQSFDFDQEHNGRRGRFGNEEQTR
eukprot:12926613-Prorocentrum_lima.AAC.1